MMMMMEEETVVASPLLNIFVQSTNCLSIFSNRSIGLIPNNLALHCHCNMDKSFFEILWRSYNTDFHLC